MSQKLNIKGLTLSRLETFCEIAAAGGISKAARNDSNRQSQFSRQLKELEQFFGRELVKRGGTLTDAGKHLLGCSSPLLNTLKQVATDIATTVPTVAFGSGESVNNWWLIPRLERLSARTGEVQWTVCNLSTNSVISGLLDSKLDLGIVRRDACCAGLKFVPVFVMRFFLCVPEPLLKRKWVPAAVLAGNGKLTVELRAVMAKLRSNFHVRLECDSAVQIKEAIASGTFGGILPTIADATLPAHGFPRDTPPALQRVKREYVLAYNPKALSVRPVLNRVVDEFRSSNK